MATKKKTAKKVAKAKATKRATPKAEARTTTTRAKPKVGASKGAVSKPAGSKAPVIGSAAPDFALSDQAGRTVKLSDFRGRKVLLYFYPKADTPGCTVQSCAVRDARADLARSGVAVLGISPDQPAAQGRFDAKFSLGFPLLSDPERKVASRWGAYGEKTMYGRKVQGIIRSSFLVGEDGRILGAWRGVKPDATVPNARKALER